MSIGTYSYYFRKPRSEIVKDIFSVLLMGGAIAFAATSPYFAQNAMRAYKKWQKYPKKKIASTFDRLRRQGVISIDEHNKQIYISLTAEGRKKAGMFQINALKIKKPNIWDRKWRLLTFDISEKKKIIREALRGKLKELGFRCFQKSIWIYPYNCFAEIDLLKRFFGLSNKEMQCITVEHIEDSKSWETIFKLSR